MFLPFRASLISTRCLYTNVTLWCLMSFLYIWYHQPGNRKKLLPSVDLHGWYHNLGTVKSVDCSVKPNMRYVYSMLGNNMIYLWVTISDNVPPDMCSQQRFRSCSLNSIFSAHTLDIQDSSCRHWRLIRLNGCAGWFECYLGTHQNQGFLMLCLLSSIDVGNVIWVFVWCQRYDTGFVVWQGREDERACMIWTLGYNMAIPGYNMARTYASMTQLYVHEYHACIAYPKTKHFFQ